MQFEIEAMVCGGCARGVAAAIHRVDPGAEVRADPPQRRVEVTTTAPRETLMAALAEAGFPARVPAH